MATSVFTEDALRQWLPQINAGGVRLEYLDVGAGDPVVLVHGVLGDLRIWRNQIDVFPRLHRTVAYSRRNHYPNPWSEYPQDYSLILERDDLIGLISGLGLGPVHLVGSSLGAAIAALVARDRPKLVRSLVLNDPALRALVNTDPHFPEVDQPSAKVTKLVKERIAEGKLEEGARIWTNFIAGEGSFERFPPAARSVLVQNARSLAVELGELPRPFTCEDAKRIVAPSLLVSGEHTALMFRRIGESLAECIPCNERIVVPASSNAPYRQNPRFFNEVVLNFLGRHRASKR